jgi:2-phosphoglycerate kinase
VGEGQRGEMTQTMYAHVNKRINKRKKRSPEKKSLKLLTELRKISGYMMSI